MRAAIAAAGLSLAVNSLGQRAFAQSPPVAPPPGAAILDPTDPQRALVPNTGKIYVWDPEKKKWIETQTGQTYRLPGKETTAVLAPSPIDREVPVELSAGLAQIPQGLGSFGLAARYDGEFLHDMKFTKASESVNGIVTNLNLSNPPKISFKYNAGTVEIPIGLPTLHLFGGSSLYAAPVFIVGGAVYDVRNKFVSYDGSGPMIGGGFGSTIMNPHCPFFGGLDVLYRDNLGVGVSPSPSSQASSSLNNTLHYYEWNVAARGDYSFGTGFHAVPSIAPWAGVEFDSTNVKLTGNVNTPGQSFSYKNEVAANDVKGIAGLDARLCGQLFGRAQVSFNDTDYAVMAKLVYQFDLSKLWK